MNNVMQKLTLYEWGYSQLCFGCENKYDVVLENGAAICAIACEDNNGASCPMYEADILQEDYNA
jgi:hypothetical protein